jgi:hypothetical protein
MTRSDAAPASAGLFDFLEPEPVPVPSELSAKPKARPTTEVAKFIHPRLPGRCIKQLKYWTGRVAVEVGPVEIEHAPTMIYILVDGRMGYTFSREHRIDLDKFHEHFCLDGAEGGAR